MKNRRAIKAKKVHVQALSTLISQIFQEYCGQAYLALRRHSNLLITLFTMMLPAGITELSSIDNISYLRQTLAVEKSEEEALKYFQTVFNEAYEGAWTTKVDWFFHSVRHGVSVTT